MKDGEGAAQMEGSSGRKLTLLTAVKRPIVSREKNSAVSAIGFPEISGFP